MNTIANILLWVSVVANAFVGLIVFLRSPRQLLNRLFLSFSVAVMVWASTNLAFHALPRYRFLMALLSYAAAAVISITFFLFCSEFSGRKLSKTSIKRVIILGAIFVFISLMPGAIATGVSEDARIATNLPMLLLFALLLLGFFAGGFKYLIKGLRDTRGAIRSRLQIMMISLGIAATFGVFFNLILPLQGVYAYTQFGPIFALVFVGGTAYAIIRHRLFDIRLVIVRSLAYILSLLTIAGIYALMAVIIALWLFSNETGLSMAQQLSYIGIALVLALTFNPLKLFFDKLTTAIFYRDAYSSQAVIDKFSALLVKTIDIDKLAHRSAEILYEAIKPQYVGVILANDGGGKSGRVVLHGKKPENEQDLSKELARRKEQILVRDELENKADSLFEALEASDCAVAARLETHGDFIGHIIFGFKVSGSAYTTQDIDLIRIIADELAVATQNALRFEEISRFNITLKEEVAQATAELRLSNRKLQQLDKAKDEFISMASHQLRTPLTSVKGYLSMVLEGDAGQIDPNQRKLIEEAFASSQRMVYLIGDFLNVSRLQTGRFVLETKPVTLPNIVKDEIEQLASTAARRDVRMEYHSPTHFPVLELDETKIRQVIMNFIDNAIFYSNTGGTIIIELFNTSDKVTFRVKDNGIGVPALERPKLFTKFFRATNARKVRPDGTGIGLFMAKKVILAHGGTVIFESQHGKGSTFGFSLPMNRHKPLENNIEKLEQ